ncbi:MAG: PrsW family glutamic-type intramembrane protease [Candidatus Krumholzibacteriia bacterium]
MSGLSLKALFGLAPVALFLAAMLALDGWKLVRPRQAVVAALAGAGAALVCRLVHQSLIPWLDLDLQGFSRYVAPLTEETAKSAWLVLLIWRRRIGFLVDAAIYGFAVGAGFGIMENVFYLGIIGDAHWSTWLLRGCGTALMHGCTAAVFAIVAHTRCERRQGCGPLQLLPALALAVLIHSGFNHFFLTPALTAMTLIAGVPLVLAAVYQQGESTLEQWLGLGFDTDAEMLRIIDSGQVSATPVGIYLASLRDRFAPEIVADMFCLLRLQVELRLKAKGLVLMRRSGYEPPRPEGVAERLAEIRFLERSIGQAGRLALLPFLRRGRRDTWERHLLEGGG